MQRRPQHVELATVAVVGLLGGVVVTAGCSEEFLPASVVVNARVLAVTAEPAEAVPGQEVTLTPLVVSPTGELLPAPPDAPDAGYRASWWRCPDDDSDALGDFAQCSAPSERVDLGTGSPYVDTVPPDLFGTLPPVSPADPAADPAPLPSDKLFGALLGYWRVVGLTVTSTEGTSAGTSGEGATPRKVDAFKRIPVYLPVRLADVDPRLAELDVHVAADGRDLGPNTNPTISAVTVHEGKADGPSTTKVKKGGTYFFRPIYDDAALQDYLSLKVDLEGLDLSDPESLKEVPPEDLLARFEKVQRCEVPTFSWFVTHGRVRRDTTLDESAIARVFAPRGVECPPVEGEERVPEVQYTAPTGDEEEPLPEDGIVRGWVVMRDGRGGTAARAFELTIE